MIRFLAVALSLAALFAGCGAPDSCRYSVQCDGTTCTGVANGCSESSPEADNQSSCQTYADSKAAELNGAVITATWESGGECQ